MKNVAATTTGIERCVSCDAPLSGLFCSRCGERALEPEALTLRHFLVHTVAHELLPDGKSWRTLRLLLLRPGLLSLEYAAGRRRPYLNPFRLLLIAIVAYTLMAFAGLDVYLRFGPVTMSVVPVTVSSNLSVAETIELVDRYGLLQQQLAAKGTRVEGDAARERFHDLLAAFVQPLSFTNVILLAAALHLAFGWKRRRFLEHAAFSMHVVSFILLSSGLLLLVLFLRGWLGFYTFLGLVLVSVLQFAYLAAAIRRFYLAGGKWGNRLISIVAALLIYFLNTAFITAVQVACAAIALALL